MSDFTNISQKDKNTLEEIAIRAINVKKSLSLGTTALTPINYNEEREKFFSSKFYNPQFVYQKFDRPLYREELNELLSTVDDLSLPDDLKFYLQDYLINLHFLNITLRYIGTPTFSQAAHALFDWHITDGDLLMELFNDYSFNDNKNNKLYDAHMIKKAFEDCISEDYALEDFNVKIDTFCHNIIRAGHKKVTIGSDIKRYKSNVQRLIVHEIESHVLQTYNIKKANNPLLELSKYNETILFSEGLAVYNEVMTRTLTKIALETYYYRLKAVSMLHKSFREIYNYLSESVSEEKAYLITFRVKRGMGDTEKPGGFPKDAGYLQGFKAVYDHLKKEGEVADFYYTKTPRLTSILKKYDLLGHQKPLVPRFLKRENDPATDRRLFFN